MKCTLGHPECLVEFPINSDQMKQALKMAEHYSINTPLEKRFIMIGVPDGADPDGPEHPLAAYPYVWFPAPAQNTIRLEMGRDEKGKRVVAIFSLKQEAVVRIGVPQKVQVHIAVFLID